MKKEEREKLEDLTDEIYEKVRKTIDKEIAKKAKGNHVWILKAIGRRMKITIDCLDYSHLSESSEEEAK